MRAGSEGRLGERDQVLIGVWDSVNRCCRKSKTLATEARSDASGAAEWTAVVIDLEHVRVVIRNFVTVMPGDDALMQA